MDNIEKMQLLSKDQLIQKILLLETKLREFEKGSKEICENLQERFKEQVQKNLEPLMKEFIELEKKATKNNKLVLGIFLGLIGLSYFWLFAIPVIMDVMDRESIEVKKEWRNLLNK